MRIEIDGPVSTCDRRFTLLSQELGRKIITDNSTTILWYSSEPSLEQHAIGRSVNPNAGFAQNVGFVCSTIVC